MGPRRRLALAGDILLTMRAPPIRDLGRLAPTVAERRALFRRQRAPAYRGWRHLAVVVVVSLLPVVGALWLVQPWGWPQALAALAVVGVGCTVVYFGHRLPMHRRMRRMELLYELHTRCHHMVFDEGQTEIDDFDDVDMVLMPTWAAMGLCWVVAPLLALPWLALGVDAALVYAAGASLYYLAYELVHLASHLRVDGPLDHVPGLGWLLRHHRRHHAWSVMHRGNFSMLVPVWDWWLGTRVRDRTTESQERG